MKIHIALITALSIAAITYTHSSMAKTHEWSILKNGYSLVFEKKINSYEGIDLQFRCNSYSLRVFSFDFDSYPLMKLRMGSNSKYVLIDNDKIKIRLDNYGYTEDQDLIKRILNSKKVSLFEEYGDFNHKINFNSLKVAMDENIDEISLCDQNRISDGNREVVIKITKLALGIIGVLIGLFILFYCLRKLSTLNFLSRLKAKIKSTQNNIVSRNKIKDEARMTTKAMETVIDEAVRISVRHAMKDMVPADDIQICSSCKGSGCLSCDDKGWIINKSQ